MSFDVINPATGERVRGYEETSSEETASAVEAAREAFRSWRERSISERAEPMRKAASVLRGRREEFANLMALEMGKPLAQGRSEIEKCAWVCEYYAEQAEGFLAEETIESDASISLVSYQPLGVVLAIMPWNFPFWQVFRFAAPTLMAGNAGLLKHAPNVPGCALAIEQVMRDAGFPDGLFRSLLIDVEATGDLIDHDGVAAVTLTGSTRAGRAVASRAGQALKKTVLELGGSDPYLVLEDADLDRAVDACVTSRLLNAGQTCIAAKRFLVVDPVREVFTERFFEKMREATMGDPLAEETTVGPLARIDLRDALHRQVAESVEQGAVCRLGGAVPDGPGAYYPPTVLTEVKPGMPAFDEELFGPVAAIVPVADEREAIALANRSVFGLGAAVFTGDDGKGRRIATSELEAGACFVNAFVKSDPRLPFGGIKQSGFGRELGRLGIREFTNVKTVYVE